MTSAAVDCDVINRMKTERMRHGDGVQSSSFLSSFMNSLYCARNKIMYVLSWRTVSALKCYFGVYFPRCFATREINTEIILSWALKRFISQVHTLFSMTVTNTFKNVHISHFVQASIYVMGQVRLLGMSITIVSFNSLWPSNTLWYHRT